MPPTEIVFYQDDRGESPVADWLRQLRSKNMKAYVNCVAAIERLAAAGHELRRPTADYLRDGVYELRARHGRVNYRILYFFHGRNVAILAHSLTKEDKVPNADIQRAVARKARFEADPARHTYRLEMGNGENQ